MKRFLCLLLVLWAFCLLPSMSSAEYELTPAIIPESAVQEKLQELGYLDQASGQRLSASALQDAILAFQEDQLLLKADGLDARTLIRLFSVTDASSISVWVPVYGGKRYHDSDSCSSMNSPEPVSLSTALALGFTPCKRCKP